MRNDFLEKLAQLCEQYEATFSYTTDDDGIHIESNGIEVFSGHLSVDAAEVLRAVNFANQEPL